jgi:hypothetical protein
MQEVEYTAERTFNYINNQPLQAKKKRDKKNHDKQAGRFMVLAFGFKGALRIPYVCRHDKAGGSPAALFRPAAYGQKTRHFAAHNNAGHGAKEDKKGYTHHLPGEFHHHSLL